MHIGNTLMWQCGNVAMWHFDSTSHPLQDANTVFWMLQIYGLPVANIWFTSCKYMVYQSQIYALQTLTAIHSRPPLPSPH